MARLLTTRVPPSELSLFATPRLEVTPRRVLVTGGAGFVGANLARRLISDGHDVQLLLRPGRPDWRLDDIAGLYTPHFLHLADAAAVSSLVARTAPEWIFHLATYGAYPHQADFDLAFQTNVIATVGLVRAAMRQGFESFVLAGTSSEYGAKDHPPRETDGVDPTSHYAATKAAATVLCRQLAASGDANLVTLRLYSVYGPFEEPTRLIPAIVAESWSNRLPNLVDPDNAHDFVFVDDAVDSFVRCAALTDHTPGAVYNVSSEVQLSLRDVVDTARDVLHITAEPEWGSMPSRPWDTSIWQGDSQSLREKTGWESRHSFRAGLARTAEWFEKQPGMKTRYIAARERSRA